MASRRGRGGTGRRHRGASIIARHQYHKFEFFEEEKSGPPQNSYDLLLNGCNGGGIGTSAATAGQLQNCAKIPRLHPSCKLYKLIKTYVDNSKDSCATLTLKTIYKVIRHSERDPFNSTYRILLWHGTKPHCIPGILQNGLIPSQGVQYFGNGVYLADRIGMSAGYTSASSTTGSRYFIFAEVNPGRVYKAHHIHQEYKTCAPPGYDSVKGMGKLIPDWRETLAILVRLCQLGKVWIIKDFLVMIFRIVSM